MVAAHFALIADPSLWVHRHLAHRFILDGRNLSCNHLQKNVIGLGDAKQDRAIRSNYGSLLCSGK